MLDISLYNSNPEHYEAIQMHCSKVGVNKNPDKVWGGLELKEVDLVDINKTIQNQTALTVKDIAHTHCAHAVLIGIKLPHVMRT